MTDYRAAFPILAMRNIVQNCSHFAYDYCRRFFLCFQAQALTVRNLQHLQTCFTHRCFEADLVEL